MTLKCIEGKWVVGFKLRDRVVELPGADGRGGFRSQGGSFQGFGGGGCGRWGQIATPKRTASQTGHARPVVGAMLPVPRPRLAPDGAVERRIDERRAVGFRCRGGWADRGSLPVT